MSESIRETIARRRSKIRANLSYMAMAVYLVGITVLTGLLMAGDKVETALGVFSGLTGVAGTVIGYWFRGPPKEEDQA